MLRTMRKKLRKRRGLKLRKHPLHFLKSLMMPANLLVTSYLSFKSKAAYKPAIFDAKGIPMIDSNIWGGSELKVNGSVAAYYTPLIGAGVALRLRAVQVIQYVEGGSGSADRLWL